jgi:alpha,alpha-trehalose phosphorylase
MQISTNFTHQHVVALMHHSIEFDVEWSNRIVKAQTNLTLKQGESVVFKKTLVYTSDAYHQDLRETAQNILEDALKKDLFLQQERYLLDHPLLQPLKVYGNDDINHAVHYNLYQLSMSGAYDTYHQIPAKGLSGEGYEGHYFWDTETYMFPYFLLTDIEKAKDILLFRYHTLDNAKQEAKKLGHLVGAKYPWRTINGDEVSSYYPAGTAQYHINAIIAYSFINYYQVTNDIDFMIKYGLEVLYETALIYLQIGTFVNDSFHITNVTGPDEYSALVDNNYYTNKMAQYHINFLLEFVQEYRSSININLDDKALKLLKQASEKMVIPYDDSEGIHLQDESFMTRKDVDVEQLKRPLLLHYHPLTIYRMKAIKQADVALGYVLLDDEDTAIMKRSVSYYERYTTHDSSLSKCMYSIIHARLKSFKLAEQYFNEQWSIDLDNALGNTQYGLHVANLGGTYLTIVFGFLGARIHCGILEINPIVPSDWDGYQVSLMYRSQLIVITVKDSITVNVQKPCEISLYGQTIKVESTKTFSLGSNHMTSYDKKIKK